ncbi:guanylate kinase/L-type calcium channel beta subunit [Hysterangium stoloniferum]|nr:guanylate kinase/L-type calcium channel beta subunit [Hysterangium stoloniferum]
MSHRTGDFLRPLVISGPSGTGKSTLISRLMSEHPDKFGLAVSYTTRKPRHGEVEGKHYYFVSRENFRSLVEQRALIEHAQFSGNFYGTGVTAVKNVAASGRRCLLDIDSQGVRQIKANKDLNPVYLFLVPPTWALLREWLTERGTETEMSIQWRLQAARREVEYARTPGVHDIVIVNDDFERKYKAWEKVALGDSSKVDELPPLDDFESRVRLYYQQPFSAET